jgi:hypothetical protein
MNNLTMHDPLLLSTLVDMYFGLLKREKRPPTVPGLALALGFNTVKDIAATLKEWEEDEARYPEASISQLLRALTGIEDYYITEGVTGKIPPALVKFTMGAYHGRRESEEVRAPGDNNTNFQIVFNAPKEFLPAQAQAIQTQANQIPQTRMLPTNASTGNLTIEVP